jgi:hypothetical protein
MSNPYTSYAERVVSRKPRKARRPKVLQSDAEAPMKPSGADAALAEREQQLAEYNRQLKEDEAKLLMGPYAEMIKPLRSFLVLMTLNMADVLLERLEGINWFKACNVDSRRIILHMIDTAIIRCRVRNDLPPISDSLPGEPPTAFEIIREKFACDAERKL